LWFDCAHHPEFIEGRLRASHPFFDPVIQTSKENFKYFWLGSDLGFPTPCFAIVKIKKQADNHGNNASQDKEK